jgi:outer membrane protein TolC
MCAQTRNLSFFQNKARENSPLINKNINNKRIIQLDLKQVNSILKKPNINLEAGILFAPIISHDNNSSSFQWVSKGATDYGGYDQAYSDGGQYQGFISIKQGLLNAGIYKEYEKTAEISSRINENNIKLNVHELNQLVSHQYIICLKAKKQMAISKQLVSDMEVQLNTMRILVEEAIYRQTDLMLLQIELQNYQLMLKTYESEYQNNIADLNLLCGLDDAVDFELTETNFNLKPDTISKSYFVSSFNLDSLSISSNQIIYEQRYKPRLDLFATAGMNSIYLPAFNRFGFSTGLTFKWTIFDGHQKRFEKEKTAIKLQTLSFEKQNFMLKNTLNKNKYLKNISSIEQRIKITNKQLEYYEDLLQIYSMEISQAQISVMDLKNLFRDIASKKQENMNLKMQKQALINLYNYWNF